MFRNAEFCRVSKYFIKPQKFREKNIKPHTNTMDKDLVEF